ncbi:hypothetical protein LSPH24S_00216 [Lysinibacillus sphaericus]
MSHDYVSAFRRIELYKLYYYGLSENGMRNGKSIGFAQLYPTFSSIALQRAYILNDIYVTDEARGQGVGTALMEKVFQYCEQQSARYVTLQTAADNVHARKLYENLNMIQDQYCNYVKYFG